MRQEDISGICRPNADLALVQTRRTVEALRQQEQTPAVIQRIQTLERWIAEREQSPIVPPEYRPEFKRMRRPEPLGYRHPGVNPGRIPTYILKGR